MGGTDYRGSCMCGSSGSGWEDGHANAFLSITYQDSLPWSQIIMFLCPKLRGNEFGEQPIISTTTVKEMYSTFR